MSAGSPPARPASRAGWPRAVGAALALLAAFLLFDYHRGTDSYIRVNDHLDGIVPMYRLLAETQPLLGAPDDRIPQVFDGIPRNSLPSGVHLGTWLYYVLDPFAAQVVHDVVMRLLAFLGMLLLLRRYALPEGEPWVVCGAALAFALLPFLPTGYLAVAGQPLLLWALLELRAGRGGPGPWVVVLVTPLYSSLVFTGLFVLLFLGIVLAWDVLRHRRLDGRLLGAAVVMGVLFLVSEWRVFYQTLFEGGYVSHRSEFVRVQGGLRHLVKATLRAFFMLHRHAPSLQSPVLLATLAAGAATGVAAWRRGGPEAGQARRLLVRLGWLVAGCAVAALLVGLWEWTPVQAVWERLGPLRMFNFHRIQWFQPLLFGVAFAVALHLLARAGRAGVAAAGVLLAAQLGLAVWEGNGQAERRDTGLGFHAYYSPELFEEIRAAIGRPPESYRVVSFGFTPAIPLYNGFYVLDGFVNDYPLAYKERFRRVIAPELEKSPRLRKHFDEWGGHVDLFSSELGTVSGYGKTLYTKDAPVRAVQQLDIDVAALRELGADYVLSAVEIRNHEALGLVDLGTFERLDSPWRIRLYAVPGGAAEEERAPRRAS